MSVVNLLSALARRWVVVLIGVGLTAVGCYQVLQTVGTQHQASSQVVLLLPPEASGLATPSNPFLNMQNGQVTLASMLAGTVSTADVNRRLVEDGNDAEYDVAVVPGAGPILQVTTTSTDPAAALATRNAVMKEIDTQLARLQKQADVPPRQLISGQRVAVSADAEVLGGSRIRALGATAAAGLLVTLLLALGLDRLLGSRGGPALGGARAAREGGRPTDSAGDDAEADAPATEPVRAAPSRVGGAARARNGGDQRSRRVG
ncbi:hypothetical protein GHK92_02775 [Nocardioides sp. dk4132]|uniref:hypothetical protein n=1 Tax=unclassified Nocardioides TaxID=2615069 RepID=UPI0012972309|nr:MULTISPECIES: hypothetical protein [unclassified Nocardioides]MQW74786.1 hypothetical protein [Nocardioides sp. dk4132]QGA06680.1 hypothetical protein GFH29_04210 [Nocardioides sp. dk884]